MAAYVKQADQVVLIMSKEEATALLNLASYAIDKGVKLSTNNSVLEAQDRAFRALDVACNQGSRSGAAIQ